MSLGVKRLSENSDIGFYMNYIYPNIKVRTSIKIKSVLFLKER
jgi:hypothetical protein